MRRTMIALAASGFLMTTAFVGGALSGTITPEQKTEFEEIVRSYLLDHPEILREMSAKLEANERQAEDAARAAALKENADLIFKAAGDPIVGNAQGDVTIVEFFDYNCSWCKRSINEVAGLVENDSNLRVVMKEFPIFGEGSIYAAKAALASAKQGKYWDLHRALFTHDGPVTEDVVNQISEGLGLDMVKLKADIADAATDEVLKANEALARTLMINGTPAFIIDDQVVPGYMPQDGLLQAIAEVRKNGGCKLC